MTRLVVTNSVNDLPIIGPAPCDHCTHFDECATQKTACHEFYHYVNDTSKPSLPIRCKTIYRALQHGGDSGNKRLINFITTILHAHSSKNIGIFYDRKRKILFHQKKDTPIFNNLSTQTEFIGFFGEEFTQQKICERIEQSIYK